MTAVRATFSDFKIIRTRKVAQLVLEVPLEEANAALSALGGVPRPEAEQWVGVAPITGTSARQSSALAQKAGILCSDHGFQTFLRVSGPDAAAEYVRNACAVRSRADLDRDPNAAAIFNELVTEYDAARGRIGRP